MVIYWLRLGTTARTSIEIRPAFRAKPPAIGPAERIGVHRQGQLLPQGRPHVHVSQRIRERINARIVLQTGIGGEQNLDGPIYRSHELGQTTPAHRADLALELAMPVIAAGPGRLEVSAYGYRTKQRYIQALKERVVRRDLPRNEHRPVPKLAYVNLQHSP